MAAGCSSTDSRAEAALAQYQAAAAANDLPRARQALLQLVRAKEDVGDYWVELGKLQASTGSYGEAYYAFTRAYELDRSNPDLLRALTELALRSGDLGQAQKHAGELDVVAPGDPWVKFVKGWAALQESRFDEALSTSDSLLAESPNDPNATVLKARALLGLDRDQEAEKLVTEQIRAQPRDLGSMKLLEMLYARRQDWPKVVEVGRRMASLVPADTQNALVLIEAGFRSGDVADARALSLRLLKTSATASLTSSVLDLWADHWPSAERVTQARGLGAAANLEQRLIYAAFLSRLGSIRDAVRLIGGAATLPVDADNVEANAVLGDALSRTGNIGGAKARLDAVLAFDPGNATALRGRSELYLRTGNAAAAINDAQKLVTVLPNSSRDRLLLARAFSAAGNGRWADRTLWTAFQEIPGDEKLFTALQAKRRGNAEAMSELQKEFERQRDAKVNRGLL
jgi:tetratricopeptide (TPR) repeat protein